MTRKPHPPILFAINRLQQNNLLGSHLGKVSLLVPLLVLHHVVLAIAITVAQVQFEQVLVSAGLDVDHSKRVLLDDAVDRLPHVDEGDAAGEEVLGFFREELLYTKGPGFRSAVAVYKHDGGTLRRILFVGESFFCVILCADSVVKNKHSLCALGFLQEIYDFGVERCADGFLVLLVGVGGFEVLD